MRFRFFCHYLSRAMNKSGLGDRYIESLDSWRQMLDLGLTTFAEKPEPVRSDCHAWSASPNYEFLATVAGIEPVAPGFSSVRIRPHLGPLPWVKARLPHPNGFEVNLRKDADRISGEISLPQGVSGTFEVHGQSTPLAAGSTTRINAGAGQ